MESAANEAVRDRFRGRRVRAPEVALIREVVAACAGLSRKELANTISELLGWTRPSGALKEPECRALLVHLEGAGLLTLPAKQRTRPVGCVRAVACTARVDPGPVVAGRGGACVPVQVAEVQQGRGRGRSA